MTLNCHRQVACVSLANWGGTHPDFKCSLVVMSALCDKIFHTQKPVRNAAIEALRSVQLVRYATSRLAKLQIDENTSLHVYARNRMNTHIHKVDLSQFIGSSHALAHHCSVGSPRTSPERYASNHSPNISRRGNRRDSAVYWHGISGKCLCLRIPIAVFYSIYQVSVCL